MEGKTVIIITERKNRKEKTRVAVIGGGMFEMHEGPRPTYTSRGRCDYCDLYNYCHLYDRDKDDRYVLFSFEFTDKHRMPKLCKALMPSFGYFTKMKKNR